MCRSEWAPLLVMLIAIALGAFTMIYFNTDFFRSVVYLNCEFGSSESNFTLAITKKDNKVQWQGSDMGRERTVEYISASSLKMTWTADEGQAVEFTLNRLSGQFNATSKVEGQESKIYYGTCERAEPRF